MELKNILNIKNFTKEDIHYLLSENDKERRKIIQKAFEKIHLNIAGNIHCPENIIRISNYCNADCAFCQFRRENNKITRFRLNREEIIEEALKQYKSGCKSILIHSGYDTFYNTDRIAYIIYSIKKKADIKITLSFGLREISEYKAWRIAGADSYFLNFVTTNRKLYKTSNSWNIFDRRILHIAELKKFGYTVGSGSIIGLPNQTIEDVTEDILFIKRLPIDYIDFCHYDSLKNMDENIPNSELIKRGVEVTQIVYPYLNVRMSNLIN